MVTTCFGLLEQSCYICIHVRQLWFTICKSGTVKQERLFGNWYLHGLHDSEILGTGTFMGYMIQKFWELVPSWVT